MIRHWLLIPLLLATSLFMLISGCNIFTKPDKVGDPIFSPPGGSYNQTQLVSIASSTDGSEIRYTLDGSDPPTNSLVYTAPFNVPRGTTVKAQASKAGMQSSKIITAFYSGVTPIPSFSHDSGTYTAGTMIHLSINTSGLDSDDVIIRYTMNGADPDSTSLIYHGGIALTESCTIKARTYYLNWYPSSISSTSYIVTSQTVATPIISPVSGSVPIQTVITISCSTEGATTKYTTNGTEPSEDSQVYTGPLTIIAGGTLSIKAKAFKQYYHPSQTASAQYNVTVPTVSKPVISPPSGNVIIQTTVTISCSTEGATIRYTTNGEEPDENSQQYVAPLMIISGGTLVVKAKAFKQYFNPSQTASAQYNVSVPTVATPIINPSSGAVVIGSTITISCSTEGATIRYTTNGSDPSESSQAYNSPLTIIVGGNLVIKARAFKNYWTPSPQASAQYNVTVPTVATPSIFPASGYIEQGAAVSISCSTQGASIRYTLNGSEPTENSQEYSVPIPLNQVGVITIKAKAYKYLWIPSATRTANLTVTGPTPEMVFIQGETFNNGTSSVTLSSYYISTYEITQLEYQNVMNYDPSYYNGETRPVENVTWFNAIEYCNILSIQKGFTPCYNYSSYGTNPTNWPSNWDSNSNNHIYIGCNWNANGFRLPTEMEWMFAARGGIYTHNYTYSGSNDSYSVAWHQANSGNSSHVVGTKAANELGTYDMSGNVWEWVWDIYGEYPTGSQVNPHGSSTGTQRVRRGGSWANTSATCAVSYRYYALPNGDDTDLGFRICRFIASRK